MNTNNISFNSNTKHQIDKSMLITDKSTINIINNSENSNNINNINNNSKLQIDKA